MSAEPRTIPRAPIESVPTSEVVDSHVERLPNGAFLIHEQLSTGERRQTLMARAVYERQWSEGLIGLAGAEAEGEA